MGPLEDVTAAWPILCEGSAERLDASGSSVVDSASSTEVPRSLSSPAATTRNLHRCFLGGMGAFSANLTLSGIWSPVLRRFHINVLEMHAVLNTITLKGASFAIQLFRPVLITCPLFITSTNKVAHALSADGRCVVGASSCRTAPADSSRVIHSRRLEC